VCACAPPTNARNTALQLKLSCHLCCHAAKVLFRCCAHRLEARELELACRFHKPHRGGSCDFAQPTAVRVVALQSKLSSFLCFWRKPPSTFQPHLSKARELESWPVLVMRLTPVPHCLAHTRGTKAGVVKHAFAGGGGRVQIGGSGCRGCEGLI
jgi:hypothetical protein